MPDDYPSFEELETDYKLNQLAVELQNSDQLRESTLEYLQSVTNGEYSERDGSRALSTTESVLSIGKPGIIGTEQLLGSEIRPKNIKEALEAN